MDKVSKYTTENGVPATPGEEKVIDALKRLNTLWKKYGNDLTLRITPDLFYVEKLSEIVHNSLNIIDAEAVLYWGGNNIRHDFGDF